VFFWNASRTNPPATVPANLLNASGASEPAGYWYGKNNESWTLSVDNYYAMLQQTGNTGMITINYGYARYGTGANPVADAAHLAADWVRYDQGRTRYWEIGNESNGEWQAGYRIDPANNKDGQPSIVTGALYGKHFNVFADSMRKAAQEIGHTIYIGAQLLEKAAESWQTATDKGWNEGVFKEAVNKPDYYIVHSYYTPYNTNSNAADILSSAGTVTKNIITYVTQSSQSAGVSVKPLAMTEWNIFATGSWCRM
jgi:alpha-L-arabinofuranosidase